MRVCALKKSKEDIEKAMKRITQKDSKRQKETSAGAKRFNENIVRMTSLPGDVSADEVLSAYRYRWQVELYFKRLKSLLEMGEIPKKRPESMETWLNGKMGLAVLFEALLSKLDFSPLRTKKWEQRSPWREMSFFAFVVKSNTVSLSQVVSCFTRISQLFLIEKRLKTRNLQLHKASM
jgi:transposase